MGKTGNVSSHKSPQNLMPGDISMDNGGDGGGGLGYHDR